MSPRVVIGLENPALGAELIQDVPLLVKRLLLAPGATVVSAVPPELEITTPLALKAVAPVPPAPMLAVPKLGAAALPVKLPKELFAAAFACGRLSV